jgi:glycerophosphoryl diester phosphodiesterase
MIRDLKFPLIIAHRGFSARYPENTAAAFQAALDAGAQMIELDVTLTRDRRMIVIHDDTVDRTTNAKGRVIDYTLSELRQLDAGSWFHPRFSEERLPALEEAVEMITARAALNIEIKPEAYEPDEPDDAIEYQVADVIRTKGVSDRVLISSFDPRSLERIARMNEGFELGLLWEGRADAQTLALCRRLNVFSWNPDWRNLEKEQAAMMGQAGIRTLTYTVNDRAVFEKLMDMGADGVFTDDPILFSVHPE